MDVPSFKQWAFGTRYLTVIDALLPQRKYYDVPLICTTLRWIVPATNEQQRAQLHSVDQNVQHVT